MSAMNSIVAVYDTHDKFPLIVHGTPEALDMAKHITMGLGQEKTIKEANSDPAVDTAPTQGSIVAPSPASA